MKLKIIEGSFAVCKLKDPSHINLDQDFVFIGKTDEETSLVCNEKVVPKNVSEEEKGFSLIKIEGLLDFSLVGIISEISGVLAKNNISIFVVSTYNTDYFLIKENNIEKTKKALLEKGYEFI
ncbi:MAG: ACT domain-containing protein [Lachnospiraceae bacterium]|nr:ACT domain-containing protein [Lachnospiraceae bacterium]